MSVGYCGIIINNSVIYGSINNESSLSGLWRRCVMAKLNDSKNLGDFILATRKRQRLTQEDLALASGVGLRFLRELEKGKETCQINKIFLVLHSLGCSLYVEDKRDIN